MPSACLCGQLIQLCRLKSSKAQVLKTCKQISLVGIFVHVLTCYKFAFKI